PSEKNEFLIISGGLSAKDIVENVLNAFDEDFITEKAEEKFGTKEITEEQYNETKKNLIEASCEPFSNPKLRDYILKVKQVHEQVIDDVNIDTVTFSGWSEHYNEDALKTIKEFRKFIEDN
ncbi:MAG: hypothetical protein K2G50_02760, partial [Anaeroplasmataceae bacterium]|nr:hypothetical protein [Anaeroplasmataceae bacterium]